MHDHGRTRTPWYSSIVTRITLVFAAFLVGMLAVMGWVSWRASRTELISQAHHAMDHTLDVAVNRLLTADRALRENLDVLATHPAVLEWCEAVGNGDTAKAAKAREKIAGLIDPVMRSRPRFAQMRLIGADSAGTEVVRFDRAGREVYRVPEAYLQSKAGARYYRATMAAPAGARLSFPIDLNREHHRLERPFVPTLRTAAPLFMPQGPRAGIVVINSDLRMLFDELLAMADSGRVLALAREDGEVLMHPDTSMAFRFELGQTLKLDDVLPRASMDEGGEQVLVGHHSFTLGPSNDRYMMAITQPMSGLLGTLRQKRNELILLFSAIGVGAIGLIALFALGFRSRLNRLTGLMERYAVGLHEDLPIDRPDEFGRMAHGLRTMQERIDARVQELEAAKAAAEASDRQRRDLLANMSHEVRTPLNAIIGMSDGVDTTTLLPEDREKIAIVRRSAQRLKGLVDDLLTHARIGEGKLALRYSDVDVRTLVRDIVLAHLPSADAKGLRVRTLLDDPTSTIRTDALRLHQIIDNLVGNAVRFTAQGEVVIETGLVDGNILRIRVTDTGPGIPPEEQQRIFERFERATASEQEQGAGLGLAITQRVVDLLGGTIELESASGKGSRFTVHIPVRPDAAIAANSAASGQDTSGLRILYVEDVATNRMLVQEWAARWGWTLTVTETGEDALVACERDRFDALLIDLGLGNGLSGLDLAKRLRAGGRHTHTPMIALTAFAEDGEDEEILDVGMNDRVTKPVDRDALQRTVAFWCDRSGTEQEVPDLAALAAQYHHDLEKLRGVFAQYRTEFIQRRLALRGALRTGDSKKLNDTRHALRPHWILLGLHGAVAALDALIPSAGEEELTAVEHAFRACDRAFLRALRTGTVEHGQSSLSLPSTPSR